MNKSPVTDVLREAWSYAIIACEDPILGEEMILVLGALPRNVSGLRDRAILLIGFCGALRRSEMVGLDVGEKQSKDGTGWVGIVEEGLILHLRGKTGWRETALGRGSAVDTCPVEALQTWMRFGRIAHGPVFRRMLKGNHVTADRLSAGAVADIVRDAVNLGGLRPDLSRENRRLAFGGHSPRSGMASSAEVDEATVQKHLGHQSPAMTRIYKRRRDRFRINLTKAAWP